MSIANLADSMIYENGSLPSDFGPISKCYLLTTENIRGILKNDDLRGKTVLSVAGSGDQMVNAYAMGASNVTCFDINYLSAYQLKLKRAAIITLNYQEYLNFFLAENGQQLNYRSFQEMKRELDPETINFFDQLYSQYKEEEIFKKLYYPFQTNLEKMKKMNLYFEEDTYCKVSSILKDKPIKFLNSDITKLSEKLDGEKFDKIILSNISQSIENIYDHDELHQYRTLIRRLSKNVNNGGSIQAGYIYDYHFPNPVSLFDRQEQRTKTFKEPEFSTDLVDCYRFNSGNDGVITYRKRK